MIEARAALEAIGALPDAEIDLAGAALQLARARHPNFDAGPAAAHLSGLAREMARVAETQDAMGRAAAIAELMVDHLGYAGDAETYDDLDNASLIHVIARRRGLPVALGILWVHCARAAGWAAWGLDSPGHFLLAVEGEGGPVAIDAFAQGQIVGQGGWAPVPNRAVLLRLQNNIFLRLQQAGSAEDALACLEDMLLVAPRQAGLWHQAAMLNHALERFAGAIRCLQHVLDLVPEGKAAEAARTAMDELRSRLT
jgi:regulator of sirC expression with transglutaminase-like and TPR domain